MCNRSLFIIIFRRNVYTRARAQTDFVYMVAKPDRPSVWTMNAREPACLCACAGRAGATHTHALLSCRATGNISSIPENAAAAVMEASAPAGRGGARARGIVAEPASNVQRGVCARLPAAVPSV